MNSFVPLKNTLFSATAVLEKTSATSEAICDFATCFPEKK